MSAPVNLREPTKGTRRPRHGLGMLVRDERGVSALEFGLFAPFLFFGFLMMVDLSRAAYERMTMDHVLRAGAQSAMTDPGTANVMKVLQSTAAESFTVGGSTAANGKEPITVTAERYCVCPDSTNIVACSTICDGTKATRAFYMLSASKTFSGVITSKLDFPQITFNPKLQVQVR